MYSTVRMLSQGAAMLAAMAALGFAALPAQAQFETNRVVNGDAEAGTGSPTGDVVPVPGWTTTSGNFTAVQYGASGGFPAVTDPGPVNRGSNFFAGGPNVASSSAFQFISLAPNASVIDAGQATFTLSGYFGGFSTQGDFSFLTATFLDASSNSLGSTQIGLVSSADRNGVSGLLLRSADGFVPAGARTVNLGLGMTRTSGSYNDGYADNLFLVLHQSAAPVPEASTTVSLGLLLGLGALALVVRRRKAALPR